MDWIRQMWLTKSDKKNILGRRKNWNMKKYNISLSSQYNAKLNRQFSCIFFAKYLRFCVWWESYTCWFSTLFCKNFWDEPKSQKISTSFVSCNWREGFTKKCIFLSFDLFPHNISCPMGPVKENIFCETLRFALFGAKNTLKSANF